MVGQQKKNNDKLLQTEKGRASHKQSLQRILLDDNMYGERFRGDHGVYTVETDYDVKVA